METRKVSPYKLMSKREWIILMLAILIGFAGGFFTAVVTVLAGIE